MKPTILLLLCAAAFAQDWTSPSYWSWSKDQIRKAHGGAQYIPRNENCMGGSFATKKHATTDGFDFEMCAVVVAYGETLEEATRRTYR